MSKRKSKVFAVVPAAGSGSRMNSSTNKQFLQLGNIPIIIRTLLAFEKSPFIDGIYAIAAKQETGRLLELCKKHKISKISAVVPGGLTRQDSVRYALDRISEDICAKDLSDIYVLIHDGARPFVTEDIIRRCIGKAREKSACAAGVPFKDTVKAVGDDNRIVKTLPRENCIAIQTPQAFLFPLIYDLHIMAASEGEIFTDDTALCEFYGKEAYIVEGSFSNIKITTPEDLLYGQVILNGLES